MIMKDKFTIHIINKCNKNSFIALLTKGLDRSADQLDYINTMIEIFQDYYNIKF